MTIKNFNDLVFTDHANNPDGVQAKLDLGNNLEISVVSMKTKSNGYGGLYGDASNGTYEVAVFHNDSMLPLSPWDDVIGWQTEAEITALMAKLQGDSKNVGEFTDQLYLEKSKNRADLGLTNHS